MTRIEASARSGDDQPSGPSVGSSSGGSPPGTGSSTRVIAIALAVVAALVALAVVAILAFGGGVREYPAGTPEATVQAYVRALDSSDLTGAYAQLSTRLKATLSQSGFADRAAMYGYGYGDTIGRVVRIDRTDVRDDRATVFLTVETYYGGGGLTPSRSTVHPSLQLVRENGAWKLDQLYVSPELFPEMP
jgi:hypothetical protein